jgi:hypothetical protein
VNHEHLTGANRYPGGKLTVQPSRAKVGVQMSYRHR